MPTVSHSWNASEPIRCVGTWPVMQTSGIESIIASVRPVTALVAPGPEVTSTHADLAGRAGIALRRMDRALLVADQHVLDLVLVEQRIVDRQHRAARIAEEVLDPLVLQGADHHLGAGHRLAHRHSLLVLLPVLPISRIEIRQQKRAPRDPACAISRTAG